MKEININKQTNCKTTMFPDKCPHIRVDADLENEEVRVTCSLVDSNSLILLLQCSEALDGLFAKKKELVIPYLMGARYDRRMQKGDGIDLKVVATLINSCNFERVYLYDVHSDVASVLINNSINISNKVLVESYNKENAVLICPDSGASKKVDGILKLNPLITEVVYCTKSRNLSDGKITLKVLTPEKCEDRNCVIIDDLCDGGGTFLAIASQINPKHLTLVVTHAIFSNGIEIFEEGFDSLIISDSYQKCSSKIINQIEFKL